MPPWERFAECYARSSENTRYLLRLKQPNQEGEKDMITLSVIKADVGGYVGHSSMHPALVEKGQECLGAPWRKDAVEAKEGNFPKGSGVFRPLSCLEICYLGSHRSQRQIA